MNLGIENRKQLIVAAALGVVALLVIAYEFMPSSSTIASTTPVTTATDPHALTANTARSGAHHGSRIGQERTPSAGPRPDLTPGATGLGGTGQVRRLGKEHFHIADGHRDSHSARPRHDGSKASRGKDPIYTPPACGTTATNTPEVLRLRQPAGRTQRRFFSPKTPTFSLPVRARLSTAATRLCEFLQHRWRSRTWWSAVRRRACR